MKILFFLLSISFSFIFAQSPKLPTPSKKAISFRQYIGECHTFYSPHNPKGSPFNLEGKERVFDMGTGFRLTTNHDLKEFTDKAKKLLAERGPDIFYKGHFYITGINMGQGKITKEAYLNALENQGLDPSKIKLSVLTYSKEKITGLSLNGVKNLLKKVSYWFPSLKKDYEAPFLDEVLVALAATSIIEIPTARLIMTDFQGIDAYALLGSHISLLLMYDIFKKFQINWLLRGKTTSTGKILKQFATSVPFIVSFNIMPNITSIFNFVQTHGMGHTMNLFLTEQLPLFIQNQWPTVVIQTLFYQAVMTNWMGGWWNNKNSDIKMTAKNVTEVLKIPILALNSVLFASASMGLHPVTQVMGISVDAGHIGIGTMAIAGFLFHKFKPNILDPLVPKMEWATQKTAPFRKKIARSIQRIKQYFNQTKPIEN